jgi:RNA polymerase sigma-70 factor (ECF subfamily)
MHGRALEADRMQNFDQLLAEARQGDRDAFDLLIRCFERDVMKTAHYLTGNLDDAQDVAQEVYIRIIKNIEALEHVDNLKGWVYRVTVNTSRDLLRKRRHWLPLKMVLSRSTNPDPVEHAKFRSRLNEALDGLTFSERAAFVFREMQEIPTEEVAEILGCKAVTVRGHLLKARQKLRRSFEDLGRER